GKKFEFRKFWAKVSDNRPDDWRFWVDNFTGQEKNDTLKDFLGYCNHSLWVGENTGVGFYFQFGSYVSDNQPYDWDFSVGDFVGDGGVNVVGYMRENGSLWIGRNMGEFYFTLGGFTPDAGTDRNWKIMSGRFTSKDSDDPDDFLGYQKSTNSLWVG